MAATDNYHALPISEVLTQLKTNEKGLSSSEAQARLKEFGKNTLLSEIRFKTLRLLLSQFKNFFVVLLILASALSFRFESATNGFVLLGVVVLNVMVSFLQERKAEKTLEKLRKIYPAQVSVRRDGKELSILPEDLVVGDIVILREGESIPADLRLLTADDLKLDQAVLTGESTPAEKDVRPLSEGTGLADRSNIAYVGTLVESGSGEGVVIKIGRETEFAKIAAFAQEQEERSLLLERIAHLGVWLTGFAGALALLIFILGLWRGLEIFHLINFAIAVFVSAVPESLPTTTTLALALTALRLSRRKALVRHLPTAETLSGINVFAFDKTGTLTLNEMSVAKIFLPEGVLLDVTGTGFSSTGLVKEGGRNISQERYPGLLAFAEAGARAATADILPAEDGKGQWLVKGDPTEASFLILADKLGIKVEKEEPVQTYAFTSARRMGSRIFEEAGELKVFVLGAPEEILPRCQLSGEEQARFLAKAQELAHAGYRVLAVATKPLKEKDLIQQEVEADLTFLGLGGLLDQPKEKVAKTFSALKKAGIEPIIITGDHPGTALAVANAAGLNVSPKEMLSGEQVEGMSDEELLRVIKNIVIFARISPTQKHRLVGLFKSLGLRVAVSGDGVNDAPALKKADVGVVMGKKGTDVSKEAADLVILDDDIETVLPAIYEARALYDNIKKFFTFLLSGNFEELLIIAAALILGLPQPFTTLQILWVNFVTDALPAFALAYDPPGKRVRQAPPRDLGRAMIKPIILYSIFLGFVALIGEALLFVDYLPDIARARTMIFTGAVLFELFIVFSIHTSLAFWKKLFTNKYLVAAFLISFALQLAVLYTPWLSNIMETVPLRLVDWALIGVFIASSLAVVEFVKWLDRAGIVKAAK